MKTTFGINNPRDYYEHLLLDQYKEFLTKANYNSPPHAIICSILAYHLREWIWNCNKEEVRNYLESVGIIKKSKMNKDDYVECKFNEYVNEKCPEFSNIRIICNGSKHFVLKDYKNLKSTSRREGGLGPDFDGDSFQTDDLIIRDKYNKEHIFKKHLKAVVDFWDQMLKKLKI